MIVKAYRQDSNLLSIHLPVGDYLVDGQPIKIEPYGGQDVIATLDVTIKRVNTTRSIIQYVHATADDQCCRLTLPVEEYIKRCSDMRAAGVDVDGDWLNEVKRLEFEMFRAVWNPVFETHNDLEDVVLEIIGAAPIDHPYIKPIRKINGDLTNTLYRYTRHLHVVDTITATLKACGWEELTRQQVPSWGVPQIDVMSFVVDPTNPKWTKLFTVSDDSISETFLTTACSQLEPMLRVNADVAPSGTYEELLKQFEANDVLIKTSIAAYTNRSRPVSKELQIGEVLRELNTIQSMLGKVDSKIATALMYKNCRDEVAKLIKMVTEAAAKQ